MPRRPSLHLRPAPGQGLAGADGSAELDGSADYRRRARRLRGKFAGRLGTRHSALGDLARQEDSHRGSWRLGRGHKLPTHRVAIGRSVRSPDGDPVLSSVLGVASAPAERLSRLVQESLCDGVLPYPRRQEVLRAARRLGVGRFQANLLIAAVQHRYDTPAMESEPRQVGRPWGWVGAAALILAIEAAIVLGALSIAHP
jgi:hypothetical protein